MHEILFVSFPFFIIILSFLWTIAHLVTEQILKTIFLRLEIYILVSHSKHALLKDTSQPNFSAKGYQ